MRIEAKITIRRIENWNVDWNSSEASDRALFELCQDLRQVLSSAGVDPTKVEIELRLINDDQK